MSREKEYREFAKKHGIRVVPGNKVEPGPDPSVLVCVLATSDFIPPVPSWRGTCDGCKDEIYFSKTAPKTDRKLCERCVKIEFAHDEQEFSITEAMLLEAAKAK